MTTNRRDTRSPIRFTGAARIAAVFLWGGLFVHPALAAPVPAHQTYSISEFDTVRLEAPVEVAITTGRGVSASAVGDRDTLDELDLQLNSRTLVIRLRGGATLGGSGGKIRLPTRVTLTTGALLRTSVLGAGSLTADALKGPRVTASLSGSGRLVIGRVQANRIDADVLGSGTMTLGGATLDLVAAVSGSGRLDAETLDARRVRVDTEGSVDARASARETAAATANGAGQVVIAGKAVCTVRKIGSASVTCGGKMY